MENFCFLIWQVSWVLLQLSAMAVMETHSFSLSSCIIFCWSHLKTEAPLCLLISFYQTWLFFLFVLPLSFDVIPFSVLSLFSSSVLCNFFTLLLPWDEGAPWWRPSCVSLWQLSFLSAVHRAGNINFHIPYKKESCKLPSENIPPLLWLLFSQ